MFEVLSNFTGFLNFVPNILARIVVNLVLTTTWYSFNSQFYQQTHGVAMGGLASSTTSKIYMQAHEWISCNIYSNTPSKTLGTIWNRMHLKEFFHHTNNLHQNIKFIMEEKNIGELAFPDTLLKWNNGKISVLV